VRSLEASHGDKQSDSGGYADNQNLHPNLLFVENPGNSPQRSD
jgi:hypothetical protein